MTTADKIKALNDIAEEVRAFKDLDIAKAATHAVPGEGSPEAKLMFIGEAPGFNEDIQGRPFVGQAGKLLDSTLVEIGLHRSDVYITNIVKFRPPDNRDPFPEEIEACRNWLDRQIQIIKPDIIVTLGRFSMAKFLPEVRISGVHGQARFVQFLGSKYTLVPMYHPAAALRSTQMLEAFKADFHHMAQTLLKSVPPAAPTTTAIPAQASLF